MKSIDVNVGNVLALGAGCGIRLNQLYCLRKHWKNIKMLSRKTSVIHVVFKVLNFIDDRTEAQR